MNTKPTKRQPTAADYVVRLHRAANDFLQYRTTNAEHHAANMALWAEIRRRPRTEARVLAMLRTFEVGVFARESSAVRERRVS